MVRIASNGSHIDQSQGKNRLSHRFRSYLSDRRQSIEIEKCISETKTIICKVPQGSVLGPLLFLLYINDIHKSSKEFFFLFRTQTITITLHLQFITGNCYRLQKKRNIKKRKDKVHKHTLVYMLTIKRRLPAL